MLAELIKAIDANAKPGKSSLLWWGLSVSVISAIGCIPIVILRPS